mgnify:CR=1 FL=1
MYRPGDRVVFTASKHSADPGPRAEAVRPEQNGEGYHYSVKKYWLVVQVDADERVHLVTRRGKERTVPAADPRLRQAHWWEAIFFRGRFPATSLCASPSPRQAASG